MKIYKYQIESALILLLCVDVTYLNELFHKLPLIQYVGRCVLLVYLLINCIYKMKYRKYRVSSVLKSIIIFVLWIFLMTCIQGGEVAEFFKIFSAPLLICFYVDQKRSNIQIYKCLSVWTKILFIFVFIDFLTQIAFPNGIYQDSMYALNWFLGYKTSRLVYSLPLCVFSSIVSMWKNGKIIWKTWLCYLLSIFTLFYSQATAASVTLLIACILINLICINRKGKFTERIWEKLLNFKFVLILYTIISVLVVYVQNSPQIQYMLVNVLHKDPTLTTRTYIWKLCISSLAQHPLTGLGYLNSLNYQNLTNNPYATSAHNMSLSILISGGVIALCIYIVIFFMAWRGFKKNANVEKKISSIAVIALLVVGITSSAMVFSTCAFIFYELMEILDRRRLEH